MAKAKTFEEAQIEINKAFIEILERLVKDVQKLQRKGKRHGGNSK